MKKTIDDLRTEIDELDKSLIKILSKRASIVSEIGKIKKSNNLPLLDKERQIEVLKKWKASALNENISLEFIEKIYELLHNYSLEIEQND